MFRKIVYLNLFLCLTLIQCEDKVDRKKIKNNIEQYVKISNLKCKFKYYQKSVHVSHNRFAEYFNTIIMYNKEPNNKELVDRTYALYTVMNCKFAFWIIKSIVHFIDGTSKYYKKKILTPDDEYVFKNKLNNLILSTRNYGKRFTRVLTYYLHGVISDSSYYMDIGVLKAIMSLNIKIDLMSSSNGDILTHVHKSHKEIVELFLVEVVELQSYLSGYCEYKKLKNTNVTKLFKIWVFDDIFDSNESNVFDLLSEIKHIGINSENSTDDCTVRQILLENIIKNHDDDIISIMISNVTVDKDSSKNETISIDHIFYEMLNSYNIDVYLWYHDSILIAIMKLLCYMIMEIPKEQFLSDKTIFKIIHDINQKVQEKKDILPEYFIEGFDIFNRFNNNSNEEISFYFKSLKNVYINNCQIEKKKITIYSVVLLNRIFDHFDDIICAEIYLKYLPRENNKYYIPGSHNKSTLLVNNSGDDDNNYNHCDVQPGACDFVLKFYIFSICAYNYIHNDSTKLKHIFNTLSNICILVIQTETNNWNLIKMAYNIAILLKNQLFASESKKIQIFLLKRFMDIIMTEINLYRVKYCRNTSKTEYLSYDSFDLKTNNDEIFQSYMQHFFYERYGITLSLKFVETSELDNIIESNHVRYFQIDYLYKNFVENRNIIEMYKDIIQVYWNGRLQSIENIFKDLREITFDPQNMYALYDVYNKFYVAVIFHEVTCQVVGDYHSTKNNLEKMKKELNYGKYVDVFPEYLSSLTVDIYNIIYLTNLKDEHGVKNLLDKRIFIVTEKFRDFSFVIDYNAKRSHKLSQNFLMRDSFHTLLHNEIDTFVNNFNKEFSGLERFKF